MIAVLSPMTTIRLLDNYMSDSVYLETERGTFKAEPHDRARLDVPTPVCESDASFDQQRLELRIVLKNERVRIWEAAGQIRYSSDGHWSADAAPVPQLAEPGGGRGIVVGAMGGFWLKRVNI